MDYSDLKNIKAALIIDKNGNEVALRDIIDRVASVTAERVRVEIWQAVSRIASSDKPPRVRASITKKMSEVVATPAVTKSKKPVAKTTSSKRSAAAKKAAKTRRDNKVTNKAGMRTRLKRLKQSRAGIKGASKRWGKPLTTEQKTTLAQVESEIHKLQKSI